MKRLLPLAILAVFALPAVSLAPPTPKASSVIADAVKEAGGSKGILIMFHASWCGWCHRLDKTFEKPEVRAVLAKRFVFAHLDGGENGDKKPLENEGWERYADQWGATNQGWPFLVTLNAKGEKVGDSKVAGKDGKLANFGFPTEPTEYKRLAEILKSANPAVTSDELKAVIDALKADRPKDGG